MPAPHPAPWSRPKPRLVSALLSLGVLLSAACEQPAPTPPPSAPIVAPIAAPAATEKPAKWPLKVPDASTIPEGKLGEAVRRGEALLTHTREELPQNVGNGLRCTSCHLNGGTVANAGPWVGIVGVFPEYRSRNDRVNALPDRVNDCFERSLNGKALDPASDDMTAIVAYMTWLSKDVPTGTPIEGRGFKRIAEPPTPDPAAGEALYAEKCSVCHGAEGQGLSGPDGATLYPALWGDASFNIGAGMARLDTAAAFVRWNMPFGQGGTLSDQQAYDVAAYFTTQPRPDFARKAEDWPKGDKPRDARY